MFGSKEIKLPYWLFLMPVIAGALIIAFMPRDYPKFVFSQKNISSWGNIQNSVFIELTDEGKRSLSRFTHSNLRQYIDFYIGRTKVLTIYVANTMENGKVRFNTDNNKQEKIVIALQAEDKKRR